MNLRRIRPLDQIARDQDDDVIYLEDKRRERAERQAEYAPNPGDSALSQLLRVIGEDEADLRVDMSAERLAEMNALHLPASKGAGPALVALSGGDFIHKERGGGGSDGETARPGRDDFDGRDAA